MDNVYYLIHHCEDKKPRTTRRGKYDPYAPFPKGIMRDFFIEQKWRRTKGYGDIDYYINIFINFKGNYKNRLYFKTCKYLYFVIEDLKLLEDINLTDSIYSCIRTNFYILQEFFKKNNIKSRLLECYTEDELSHGEININAHDIDIIDNTQLHITNLTEEEKTNIENKIKQQDEEYEIFKAEELKRTRGKRLWEKFKFFCYIIKEFILAFFGIEVKYY